MTDSTVQGTERMVVTRVFDAPRELVWRAWTEPEYVKQWWGPRGFTTPVCKMDFWVGGKFLYCMRSPDGQEFWNGGEYLEITQYEKVVFSMYFADPDGNRVESPSHAAEHEAIENENDTIVFEDLGNGQTRLTYTGNETMENALKSGQLEGMNQILDKFAGTLGSLTKQNQRA